MVARMRDGFNVVHSGPAEGGDYFLCGFAMDGSSTASRPMTRVAIDARAPGDSTPVHLQPLPAELRPVTLTEAIVRFARSELNVDVPLDAFRLETIGAHLFMNFRVVDEHGRQLGMGRNLVELKRELAAKQASS